jgi:hypothetical protein
MPAEPSDTSPLLPNPSRDSTSHEGTAASSSTPASSSATLTPAAPSTAALSKAAPAAPVPAAAPAAAMPEAAGSSSSSCVVIAVVMAVAVAASFAAGMVAGPYLTKSSNAVGVLGAIDTYGKSSHVITDLDTTAAPSTTSTTTTTTTTTTSTSTPGATTTLLFPDGEFKCNSHLDLGPILKGSQKGVALDDTTFRHCPERIPQFWPNADKDKMSSLRLFKAWDWRWGMDPSLRMTSWTHLRNYIWKNNVKVLFGTQVTCNQTDDDYDWVLVKDLMTFVGRQYAMGLAVGNEIELLWTQQNTSKDCIKKVWDEKYFLNTMVNRIEDLNSLNGFHDLTITTVMGGYVMAGEPFVENENAQVMTLFKTLLPRYGKRLAFTWNIYSYFDPWNKMDPGPFHTCNAAMMRSINFAPGCIMFIQLAEYRRRMKVLTGANDYKLWLGETGWSYPQASTLSTAVAQCSEFSTQETMSLYYQNFLDWDLGMGWGIPPVDHAFFFTFRDSVNFARSENFGLITTCAATQCKLQEE